MKHAWRSPRVVMSRSASRPVDDCFSALACRDDDEAHDPMVAAGPRAGARRSWGGAPHRELVDCAGERASRPRRPRISGTVARSRSRDHRAFRRPRPGVRRLPAPAAQRRRARPRGPCHGRAGRAHGGVVAHRSDPAHRHIAPPPRRAPAAGRRHRQGRRRALRRSADLSVSRRVHPRARHAEVGAPPPHRAPDPAAHRRKPATHGPRLHGRHRPHQHVGQQLRDRDDDDAYRHERHHARPFSPRNGEVQAGPLRDPDARNFAICVTLGIAYGGQHRRRRHAHRHAPQPSSLPRW